MHTLHHQTNLQFTRCGLARRDFLRVIPAAALAAGSLSWTDLVTAKAADLRKEGMACILLWMQGGPSQFETFSPKPDHANGGGTKAIPTAVSGIEICEHLPKVAEQMKELCLIRSMNSKEGSHPRATYLMHTGYLPTATVKFPTLGSIVSKEIGDAAAELPSFVRIGQGRFNDGAGLLGVDFDPFVMQQAGQMPENTKITTSENRFNRRLGLLGRLEGGRKEVEDHQKLYSQTARMVLSPEMKTFDLGQESSATTKLYGSSNFGKGCLLARRLVEKGVTFVEVSLGNWDSHQNNADQTKRLCGELDQPYAALIQDLKERGMLERTLVIWAGEFGRTPRINPNGGRDHYPRAFNVVLSGGGVKGGQLIGKTSAGGDEVKDRPIGVTDLFQSGCRPLKIDAAKENMSSVGRPIKLVDGGEVVKEVFG